MTTTPLSLLFPARKSPGQRLLGAPCFKAKACMLAACMGLMTLAGTGTAATLINGNFETFGACDPTFAGWIEGSSAVATNAATPLNGSGSLLMNATTQATVTQTLPSAMTTPFTFSFSFAALAPSATGQRSVNFLLSSNTSAQFNLRIAEATNTTTLGDVQIFSGTGGTGTWNTVLSNVVNYSTSLSTPVINTFTMTGIFSPSTSSYSVSVNGSSTGTLSYFQNANPANVNAVLFTTASSTSSSTYSYVIDDVVLTPEPSKAILCSMALMGLLMRRRRAS